jgi:3-methyl-2-oxobutanoate hydroxymethyltransferase
MRTKITTASLREMKRDGEKVVALTAYDHMLAGILDAAGIDVVLVGDSVAMVVQGRDTTVSVTMDQMTYHTSVVASAVKRALVVADMPFLSYQVSVEDALRNAGRLLKEGMAEAVKLEGGAAVVPTVRRLVDAGIPVMGHLGLTPQSINQFGTYKTRGTDPAEASQILADAHALADAGAFAVVLEKVPAGQDHARGRHPHHRHRRRRRLRRAGAGERRHARLVHAVQATLRAQVPRAQRDDPGRGAGVLSRRAGRELPLARRELLTRDARHRARARTGPRARRPCTAAAT